MPARSLHEIVDEARRRFSVGLPTNWDVATNPLGDDSLAVKANEAQEYLAAEAIRATRGPKKGHNKGVLLRSVLLTIEEDGSLWLPEDMEKGLTVQRGAGLDIYDRLADWGETPAKIGGGCGGEFIRAAFDRLVYPTGLAGQSRWVSYNSNLRGLWVGGTVASAGTATMTPSTTPAHASLPISTRAGTYAGMKIWVKNPTSGAIQRARIKTWDGTAFTLYEAAWPGGTPSASDLWSTISPLPYDDLLLYEMGARTVEAEKYKDFARTHQRLLDSFYPRCSNLSFYSA